VERSRLECRGTACRARFFRIGALRQANGEQGRSLFMITETNSVPTEPVEALLACCLVRKRARHAVPLRMRKGAATHRGLPARCHGPLSSFCVLARCASENRGSFSKAFVTLLRFSHLASPGHSPKFSWIPAKSMRESRPRIQQRRVYVFASPASPSVFTYTVLVGYGSVMPSFA
jgi:hypothetical protein